ncbi:MAG TPA: hypothetical protein VGD72_02060 [Mycobacteriales bacterium]|jgi:hypothetical protein
MAARAGNGADGGRTTPRRAALLFRIVSLTAFAAGVWYLVGTAAAQAGEQVVPVGLHVADGTGALRICALRPTRLGSAAHGATAPGAAAYGAAVRRNAAHCATARSVTVRTDAAALRMLFTGAPTVAPGDVAGSVTGDCGLAVLPRVRGLARAARGGIDRLTPGSTVRLPGIPPLPSLDAPPGEGTPAGRAGHVTMDPPAVHPVGPAAPRTASAPATATWSRGAAGSTRAAAWAVPGRAGVASAGMSAPAPSRARTVRGAVVLSAWTADSGLTDGTPGKTPSLCAVAHDDPPPPVVLCTVTSPGSRVPALRLRAMQPPVSPD